MPLTLSYRPFTMWLEDDWRVCLRPELDIPVDLFAISCLLGIMSSGDKLGWGMLRKTELTKYPTVLFPLILSPSPRLPRRAVNGDELDIPLWLRTKNTASNVKQLAMSSVKRVLRVFGARPLGGVL